MNIDEYRELDHQLDPIPEWRCHLIEACTAVARALGSLTRHLLPHRTWRVYSGLPDSPYLVESTWMWRGRVIAQRRHRAF